MSRKEIAGARFPQFHGARIRRNFVSISVLQRCPILDTGKRRGKGRERYLRWTNTHVYHRCTKCAVIWPCSQCAPAYLKCKYSDSPLYSRGSYCSITACPFFLSPPPPLHYNRLRPDDIRFPLNNFHNGTSRTRVVSYITRTRHRAEGEIYFE